jgi:hypothetical protein
MRMYYSPKASSTILGGRLRSLLALAVVAALALILFGSIKVPLLRGDFAAAPTLTFGVMLASLGAVVVSVVLPERSGKFVLALGALGFFLCLAAGLVFGVRF